MPSRCRIPRQWLSPQRPVRSCLYRPLLRDHVRQHARQDADQHERLDERQPGEAAGQQAMLADVTSILDADEA